MILVTYWPQDSDILQFLWQYKEQDVDLKPDHLLRLFNMGKFDTAEVNEYRMRELVSFVGYQENVYTSAVVSQAAKGLAISHPEKAIPALIHAGLNQIKPRAEILITLAGYSDEQLDPYFARLVPLVFAHVEEIPDRGSLAKALARLKPYARQPHEGLPSVPIQSVGDF